MIPIPARFAEKNSVSQWHPSKWAIGFDLEGQPYLEYYASDWIVSANYLGQRIQTLLALHQSNREVLESHPTGSAELRVRVVQQYQSLYWEAVAIENLLEWWAQKIARSYW